MEDTSRTTRESYNGLAKRLSSYAFVNNLRLMYDALQELSELSIKLQKRDCTIIIAHKAICQEARVFEAMLERRNRSRHSQLSQSGIEENSFQGVPLYTGRSSDRTLDQRAFFGCVARNLLYSQYWPENAGALFGEDEVETLCQQFGIDGHTSGHTENTGAKMRKLSQMD